MDQDELMQRLDKLNDIGIALSAERDKAHLLERILIASMELTNSDAGTLYSLTFEKKLRFEIIRNDTLKIYWKRGEINMLFPTDDIPLLTEDFKPNEQMVVVYAVIHDRTVNIEDAYANVEFDFSGTRKFDQKTGYHCQSVLTVPMKNNDRETIAVLQLINAKDRRSGNTIAFSQMDQHLVESLASQAAVAMTNQALIESLKEMFESLVKVLANAIDDKSPITGRHCKRVPIIAMLLAHAVNAVKDGKYKETQFTPDELYELEIAALLHDCGKIVTPVNVVEKGKKLEGIWDRMDSIDTRLSLMAVEAEREALEKKLTCVFDKDPSLKAALMPVFEAVDGAVSQKMQALLEAQAFLHECNQGREVTDPTWKGRLEALSLWMWKDLGGKEWPLLSDKEKHELSVEHGTLTAEERKIIQDHVVMTIKMLKDIPYPKNLRHVPEIAGAHHERMDGKGYPNGLTRFQMSLRARILGIADIFEALTAPDRPYKKPMPLSEALAVMNGLKDSGHIDPDLWDLFTQQKVYLDYGKQYLDPKQLDVS